MDKILLTKKNDDLYDDLDKELKKQGLRFIRYADDFSIYTWIIRDYADPPHNGTIK